MKSPVFELHLEDKNRVLAEKTEFFAGNLRNSNAPTSFRQKRPQTRFMAIVARFANGLHLSSHKEPVVPRGRPDIIVSARGWGRTGNTGPKTRAECGIRPGPEGHSPFGPAQGSLRLSRPWAGCWRLLLLCCKGKGRHRHGFRSNGIKTPKTPGI